MLKIPFDAVVADITDRLEVIFDPILKNEATFDQKSNQLTPFGERCASLVVCALMNKGKGDHKNEVRTNSRKSNNSHKSK